MTSFDKTLEAIKYWLLLKAYITHQETENIHIFKILICISQTEQGNISLSIRDFFFF